MSAAIRGSNAPSRKSFAQVAAEANVSRTSEKRQSSAKSVDTGPKRQDVRTASPAVQVTLAEKASKDVPEPGLDSELASGRVNPDHEQLVDLLRTSKLEDLRPQPTPLDSAGAKDNSDTKSVASRTTLTIDEKESLRPDDSASMQAAPEQDAFSPAGSIIAGSRLGSEQDVRAFRDQLQEIDLSGASRPDTRAGVGASPIFAPEQRNGGIVYATPPVTGPSDTDNAKLSGTQVVLPLNALQMAPDEKLLEALASPKDRLFVLKIEQDMIDFVKDSTEEYLQLPQTNSFYRMLSHKLADYYLLGHLIDDSMTSVRIYRTPNCRLPPSLINTTTAAGEGVTPPPSGTTRKIMRRGAGRPASNGLFGATANSADASMAASESGGLSGSDEGRTSGSRGKDKALLSREERENRYNEARARIFKDFREETTEPPDGSKPKADTDNSRSSSTSGVKKGRKTRRANDDGFEARSAYSQYANQSYAPVGAYQPASVNALYSSAQGDFGQYSSGPPPYQENLQYQAVGFQSWGREAGEHHMWTVQQAADGFQSQYNIGRAAFGQDYGVDGPGRLQPYASPTMASQLTPKPTVPSLAAYNHGYHPQNGNPNWQYQNMQSTYPTNGPGFGDSTNMPSAQMLPAYGIPGYNLSSPQFYMQHGHYNVFGQQNFNPQSQTFVPDVHRSPYMGSPGPQFAAPARYGPPPPLQQQAPSNAELSGMPSPQVLQARSNGQKTVRPQLPAQSSISKWGTPPTLPPKPPPPASSLSFQVPRSDYANQLPPNPYTSNGQSMGHQ